MGRPRRWSLPGAEDAAPLAARARARRACPAPRSRFARRRPRRHRARRGRSGALVGAGTVLDASTGDRAVEAGARFVVSPGLDVTWSAAADALGRARACPGVATATEPMTATAPRDRRRQAVPGRSARRSARWPRRCAAPFPRRALRADRRDRRRRRPGRTSATRGAARSAAAGWRRRRSSRDGRFDEIDPAGGARPRGGGGVPRGRERRREAHAPARARVPLRRRLARRGDAAARSRRGPDPHGAAVPTSGRAAASTTSRAGCAGASGCGRRSSRALADNDVGRLVEDLMLQGGVDTSLVRWVPFDGVGRDRAQRAELHRARLRRARRGRRARIAATPPRPAWRPATSTGTGCSATHGVRWLHTGGIFAALSRVDGRRWPTRRWRAARRHGSDRLLRPQLPTEPVAARGGPGLRSAVNRGLAQLRRRDDRQRGGLLRVPRLSRCPDIDRSFDSLDAESFRAMIERGRRRVPQRRGRGDDPADGPDRDRQRLGRGRVVGGDAGSSRPTQRPDLEILDRVGGGDRFASGLIYGLLERRDLETARRVWRRPRRAGDDDARRHVDGDA